MAAGGRQAQAHISSAERSVPPSDESPRIVAFRDGTRDGVTPVGATHDAVVATRAARTVRMLDGQVRVTGAPAESGGACAS